MGAGDEVGGRTQEPCQDIGAMEPLYSCFQIFCCRQGLTVATPLPGRSGWRRSSSGVAGDPSPAQQAPCPRGSPSPWIPLLGEADLLSGLHLAWGPCR